MGLADICYLRDRMSASGHFSCCSLKCPCSIGNISAIACFWQWVLIVKMKVCTPENSVSCI